MAACPLCTASIDDGAARCPSCHVPFTTAAPALPGPEGRTPRAMIPTPPPTLRATRPAPLAAQLPPQPPPPPPTTGEPPPWSAAPPATGQGERETAPAYALGTASAPVTGLVPVTPETRPWWRDPRLLVGAPVALVVLVVGWLLLTTGDVERVTVTVPSVAGVDSLDAKTLLERSGFVVPFAGTGTVTAQDPPAGEQAEVGTAVVLTVEPYPAPPAPPPVTTSATRAPTTPTG